MVYAKFLAGFSLVALSASAEAPLAQVIDHTCYRNGEIASIIIWVNPHERPLRLTLPLAQGICGLKGT